MLKNKRVPNLLSSILNFQTFDETRLNQNEERTDSKDVSC